MFKTDPGDESGAERKVEETLVGYREDYERRREGEKDNDEAMEVVVV